MTNYLPTSPKHSCVVEKPRKHKKRKHKSYFHCDNHKKSSELFFHQRVPPQPDSFWNMGK